MKIKYTKKFLKDLDNLDSNTSKRLIKLIDELKCLKYISDYKKIKKIVGFKLYYRIRIGEYRLGLKFNENILALIRIKYRKDIYKIFP